MCSQCSPLRPNEWVHTPYLVLLHLYKPGVNDLTLPSLIPLLLHPCNCLLTPDLRRLLHHLISLPPVNAGLPLNIAALMPMLMVHFDQPDDVCAGCAQTLSKVQWSVHLMYDITLIHPPACMSTHVHPNVLIYALH